MKVIICEDESILAQKIAHLIQMHFPTLITEIVTSGQALLAADDADLYLLDIHLGDMTGLELAKHIRQNQQKAMIIFITAFKDYVFEAFDYEPLHYLVKPIDDEKLLAVMQKALEKLEYPHSNGHTFTVQTKHNTLVLHEDELLYAEAQGRKIILYLEQKTIDYYGRISQLEQQLQGAFFRNHRSYLVHFKHIKRYDQTSITLTNQQNIPIARNRQKDFIHTFTQYLNEVYE